MEYFYIINSSEDIRHHGILGQKWGKKNGPPYPLGGGDYTVTEQKAIEKARRNPNSIYNKKHFDTVIKKDKDTLSTLSYDANRTENVDMFYAAYKTFDKHQYNTLFNKKIEQPIYDENGKAIGTGQFYKFRINNKVNQDVKVASEDSSAKIFTELYNKDRDFYNFVTDKDRMRAHFVDSKYKFKGYRESRKVLENLDKPDYKPTDNDIKTIYRMFNYVIPSDGGGNQRMAKDVKTQRTKFFDLCKKKGYGAILDTNDALYGAFKATAPVIVFDSEKIVKDSVKRTNVKDKTFSEFAFLGRKILGV